MHVRKAGKNLEHALRGLFSGLPKVLLDDLVRNAIKIRHYFGWATVHMYLPMYEALAAGVLTIETMCLHCY